MTKLPPIPKFFVTINGVPDPTIFGYITEIVVDTSIFMPSMFTITLSDQSDKTGLMKFVDNALTYRLGAPVTISAMITSRTTGLPSKSILIVGEITSLEPEFTNTGTINFKIRGYDRAHRLTLGKKTRAWGGLPGPSVTDMQIVSQIASEYGLIPKVDPSPLLYNYVLQYNQSDWEFLCQRAQMLGYEVYVDALFLKFQKAGQPRGFTPTDLKWSENLRRFEPRIVTAGAVTGVTAQGWDESTQKEVTGKAVAYSGREMAQIPGAALPGSKAVKVAYMTSPEDFVADPNITSPAIATAVATARLGEHENQFVRAYGEAEGHPEILAGSQVAVTQVGIRFSGKYYVTQARHILREGDYKVQFEVTGRHPNTFHSLVMGKETATSGKINGVVVGVVTNNTDVNQQGRVKVKFPWMDGEYETGWARVAMVGSGKERGIFFTPEVNDEVLVAFDQGDFNSPFIVGSLWSGKNTPPKAPAGQAVTGGQVNQRIVKSKSGHVIVLDDTPGAEKVLVQDKTGKNSIEIDSVKNSFTIKSAGDLTLDVTGKLILKSQQDLSMQSSTKVAIQGQTDAAIKAGSSELTLGPAGSVLKGTQVDVQANAKASLKGNAMVEVQGGIVKIN